MKNNFKSFVNFIIIFFCWFSISHSNDQFIFDVTEIEILKNGNQINGYKGGTVTTLDGDKIIAEEFLYNKIENILEAKGSVQFINKINQITIFSDKAIYFKNEEKVTTKGNSKAVDKKNTITANEFYYDKIKNILNAKESVEIIDLEKDIKIYSDDITYFKNEEKVTTIGETISLVENKYNFKSSDVSYFHLTSNLSSQKKSTVEDNEGNIYKLDKFNYSLKKKLLKGKNLKIFAKNNNNKSDEYFFSEGFFNLEKKSFVSKATKIKIHKDIFGNKENDPRLYGSTSSGDENKTVINKGIFTSCKFTNKRSPWCIKSKKITHDKINQNLIYENAILKVYDVPVMYFPKFFHPDPTVKRRSGFLQPQFNNSETLGSSIHIPYFKTLGVDKDYTFKPTIFENKKYILQNEYRKKYESASLITDFSLTKGYKSSINKEKNSISHFFLNYKKDLEFDNFTNSKIEAKIEKVTNDTYLKVFQNNLFETPVMPVDKDLMESKFHIELENENFSFNSGMRIYENLSGKNSDRYQYILPYYEYIKDMTNENFPGSLNFSSSGENNLKNTNNLKTSIQNQIQYNSIDYIENGFKNSFGIYLKNNNTIAKNDAIFSSSPQIDGFTIFNLVSSYPLNKINKGTTEYLTPKVSVRLNPGNNMKDHSADTKIITADNVFDINRLGISDSYEAGKSITLGLDYKFDLIEKDTKQNLDIKDRFLEFKLATVLRDKVENNIPTSSTIDRKNSNLFGSINNNLFENINFGYDFSIDNDLESFDSQSFNTEISVNNFLTTFDFIEQNSKLGETHVLSNTTQYKIDENNFIKFSTRRNKTINLTEYYNLSYEYKNDCLTAALRFNKVFYQDNDLKPSEDLFFTITLIPLTTYERGIYKSGSGWFR
tara:strand:+ start:76 stop:2733 length:2658 start_codon:yes stop_codon:yes gene_type:complete